MPVRFDSRSLPFNHIPHALAVCVLAASSLGPDNRVPVAGWKLN